MGFWGYKLYDNDLALDVRDDYKQKLEKGKDEDTVTKEMLERYREEISDIDEAPIFWYAFADIQWEFGRLEDFVKEKAQYYLENGYDLELWADASPKIIENRKKVLSELKQKLLSSQPPKKKIVKHKNYHCQWKMGDVYAYPLVSEYAKEAGIYGEYFLFHKIREVRYYPEHIIPVVRVKITENGILPKNEDEFDQLKYVQVSRVPQPPNITNQDREKYNEFGEKPEYQMKLINTSKRIIPKSLIYLGNYQNVKPPKLDYVPPDISLTGYIWKFFDDFIIRDYKSFNCR